MVQALLALVACIKRARPLNTTVLVKQLELHCAPMCHVFTLEDAFTLVTSLHECEPIHAAIAGCNLRLSNQREP